ncbi:MAG TPA: hypothetical protein GX005_02275 [Bacteroidales bacterium]|nr:hypothetical protein [Bacteroidales bacterium]
MILVVSCHDIGTDSLKGFMETKIEDIKTKNYSIICPILNKVYDFQINSICSLRFFPFFLISVYTP